VGEPFDVTSDPGYPGQMTEDQDTPKPSSHTVEHELARMMTPMNKGSHLDPTWREEALCAQMAKEDPYFLDLWFAPEETVSAATAASACFSCPVRTDCLEWASVTKQRFGIWGGQPAKVRLTHKQRPHDYGVLVELGNPYDTESPKSKYHVSKLTAWTDEESDPDE